MEANERAILCFAPPGTCCSHGPHLMESFEETGGNGRLYGKQTNLLDYRRLT